MSSVPTKRPNTVTSAVIMLFAMLVLGAITAFYLQTHNAALKSMQAQAPHMGGLQNGMLVGSLILNLFLQYKIFIGRNWARITALVLFLIAVLTSIPSFLGVFPVPASIKIMSGVGMFIQLVAYIMLFTGAGNAWFKSQMKPAQVTNEVEETKSPEALNGAKTDPHASNFLRAVYPKLIGFGALGVGVVCIAWTIFMVWGTCRMMPRIMPSYTCTSRFAVSMLLRQYWLLMAYAVLSIFTGICLLTRRAWAKWLAVAILLLSIVYLAGEFSWMTWGLLHPKAILGDQPVNQFKVLLWIDGSVVALLCLTLAFLAIVMTRVPWLPGRRSGITELE